MLQVLAHAMVIHCVRKPFIALPIPTIGCTSKFSFYVTIMFVVDFRLICFAIELNCVTDIWSYSFVCSSINSSFIEVQMNTKIVFRSGEEGKASTTTRRVGKRNISYH
mmetsp:Transcript_19356/g.22203  ORF Transcript_19356/g.22203 Transcript_19356/m.22203 type:complete len:108 (-) Transcript_19356:974-1297(-)